ncbi:MAG TPA: DUF5319 family protein [Actinomycetota bacterium]|nr:DUF5319 family protein [Actinomycetota bacterium]
MRIARWPYDAVMDEYEDEPLDEQEREALRQDLVDVEVLKQVLGDQGIKGTVFFCPDCDEDHYLTWDLLQGNLQELLDQGESPVHEPAFDPNPDDYVSWDYARGFLDGYESFQREDVDELGRRLTAELTIVGLSGDQITDLLARMGLAPPSGTY